MAPKTTLLTSYIFILLFDICALDMTFLPKRNIIFPKEYSSCRGTTIYHINMVQYASICYDSTSPLWRTTWSIEMYKNCYCFFSMRLRNRTKELVLCVLRIHQGQCLLNWTIQLLRLLMSFLRCSVSCSAQ